jgi:hypothetical protein
VTASKCSNEDSHRQYERVALRETCTMDYPDGDVECRPGIIGRLYLYENLRRLIGVSGVRVVVRDIDTGHEETLFELAKPGSGQGYPEFWLDAVPSPDGRLLGVSIRRYGFGRSAVELRAYDVESLALTLGPELFVDVGSEARWTPGGTFVFGVKSAYPDQRLMAPVQG